jgi:S1-C subfamily serine protease
MKLLLSAIIGFVAVTIALGYFGFSTSVSGIRDALLPAATTTEDGALAPAPEATPLPPADPAQPSFTLPDIIIPKFPIAPDVPVPSIVPTPVKVAPAPITPVYPTTPVPSFTPAPEPDESEEEYVGDAKSFAQGALVNIICSPKTSALKKSISGTGVIIDSRGIILTVAHVGHYFLLENYPEPGSSDCIIRTGSPAKTAYDAKLIYVSPEWVEENAGALASARPRGNGQNDFALLAITTTLTSRKLPASFTAVPLSSGEPEEGDSVAIGSYGAEFLSGAEIQSALYPTIDEGKIADVYTYGSNDVDVISVEGSDAAQSGSSGGGVVNTDGRFIGLITTSSLTGGTAQRTLYAITPDHIRASFRADTGSSLDSYLKGSLSSLVEKFEDDINGLAATVWEAIW